MSLALRINEVEARVGLKKSAIYKKIGTDNFPKGIKVSPKVTIWKSDEIDDWLRQKALETEALRLNGRKL